MIIIVQGIYMSLFKKYLAEARNWSVSTQKAEKIIHKTLRMSPKERSDKVESDNSDISLASKISNAIHSNIVNSVGGSIQKDKLLGVRHVGETKVASRRRKKILGIPYFTTGRPVEDIGATTNINGKVVHHLVDLKLGASASAGSWSARKINMLLSGVSRESIGKNYKKREANKQIVPYDEIRTNSAKSNIAKNIHDYFNSGIHKEALNRNLNDNMSDEDKRRISNNQISNRQENIVKQIMNVHEKIPENVKRYQVNVDSKIITIHDPDHAWKFFTDTFKPTSYSTTHKIGGQTVNIYAHNNDGESFHLASIGVKHRRGSKQRGLGNNGSPEPLDYNIKHKLFKNLTKKYGYNEFTSIPR